MIKPDYPDNEATRLDTLRSLNILDTAPEERFDRLTRLAKRLFGVPIALVSLVDADRQWFKSCQGLDTTETPRDMSFCAHAIHDDDIMVVSDTLRDERFLDNPLVAGDPKIRFYAGCPLEVPNGSKLGTLCLIDREPRVMGDEDRELLRDLAKMAEQELAAVQLATMDELTLLSNRRGFMALAQHAIHLCKRLDKPASLLFFDLDAFKQINDSYGHAEGDRALVSFGRILLDTFRKNDVIGRLGGDEFAVLSVASDNVQTRYMLDRFEQAISAHNTQAARGYDISYSVGIVEYDAAQHFSINDLLHRSDELMYAHKRDKSSLYATA